MQLDRIKNPLKIKRVSFEKCFIIYSTDLSEVSVSVSDIRSRSRSRSRSRFRTSGLGLGLGLELCGLDYNTGLMITNMINNQWNSFHNVKKTTFWPAFHGPEKPSFPKSPNSWIIHTMLVTYYIWYWIWLSPMHNCSMQRVQLHMQNETKNRENVW